MLKLIKKMFKKPASIPLRSELTPEIDLDSYRNLLHTLLKPIKKEASKNPEHYLNTVIINLESEIDPNKTFYQEERIVKFVKEINQYIK